MSILLQNAKVFANNGICVRCVSFSSIINNLNSSFRNIIYGNIFHKKIHVSFGVLKQSTNPNLSDSKEKGKSEIVKPTTKPKKEKQTYITLIGLDNKISVTTKEDALKLSTRRDLRLIKVSDYSTKTDRPTYQLMTTSQYLQEDTKENQIKDKKKDSFLKGQKIVSISQKINKNDLDAKINMMKKWIAKRNEVRVVITGDNTKTREEVFQAIESELKNESRTVQKRERGLDLRFQLLPLKKVEETPQSEPKAC